MKLQRAPLERIQIEESCEIEELAGKLNIMLSAKSIPKIIDLGMKSLCSEKQLSQTVKELEERKKKLEFDFLEIARQHLKLESRFVGLRTQAAKVFRDNRVLTMHLCVHTLRNEYERQIREELIDRYIAGSKLMYDSSEDSANEVKK